MILVDKKVPITKENGASEPDTVRRSFTLSEPESPTCGSQSRPAAPFVELRLTLPSDLDMISPLADQLMQFASRFRKGDNFEIELALREAISNAIVHGNQEDPQKRVQVSLGCATDGEVSLTVQDEGQGFEANAVPNPTTAENRFRRSGRGIYLMSTLMDEVCFEQKATVVYMRKSSKVGLKL